MAMDRAAIADKWQRRASAAGDDLVKGYINATDKVSRSASPEAQANYEAAMRDPAVLKLRQSRIAKLSEGELNAAMQATGASAYSSAVNAKSDKYANRVAPFLDEQERLKASAPKRTRDLESNMARVKHFAKGMQDLKRKMG